MTLFTKLLYFPTPLFFVSGKLPFCYKVSHWSTNFVRRTLIGTENGATKTHLTETNNRIKICETQPYVFFLLFSDALWTLS